MAKQTTKKEHPLLKDARHAIQSDHSNGTPEILLARILALEGVKPSKPAKAAAPETEIEPS